MASAKKKPATAGSKAVKPAPKAKAKPPEKAKTPPTAKPKAAASGKPAKPEARKAAPPVKAKAPALTQKPTPAKTLVPAKPGSKEAAGKAPAKPAPKAKAAPGAAASAKKSGKAAAAPVPEAGVQRPVRPFFIEVKPGAERVIKRGDKSLAAPAPLDIQSRRKGTAADETPEELVERIERELEHQFFAKRSALKPQLCTKCGINAVTERFTIDRELGYCADCAEILHLGETKEARRMEFNPSVMKAPESEAKPAPDKEDEEASGEEPVPDID